MPSSSCGGSGDESGRVEVAQRQPHQRHQQLGVVGDVHHRGGQQRPDREGVPPVQRIGLADQRLVVADVVGDREAGEDREQAEPEHGPGGVVAEQEDDDRREDDEADVHDLGEGHHRRLVGARLLDLRPVEEPGESGQGDNRDDAVKQAGAHLSALANPAQTAESYHAQAHASATGRSLSVQGAAFRSKRRFSTGSGSCRAARSAVRVPGSALSSPEFSAVREIFREMVSCRPRFASASLPRASLPLSRGREAS